MAGNISSVGLRQQVRAGEVSGDARRDRLAEWFYRWNQPMRRWLLDHGMVRGADAEDVSQEVFLRVLLYSEHDKVENPQTYLYQVAKNVAIEWRSRCCRKQPHQDGWLDDLAIDDRDEPENLLARRRDAKRVQEAVQRLTPRQQAILHLRVYGGLTYKEIGQKEGLRHRIVVRDLSRAYRQLRLDFQSDEP